MSSVKDRAVRVVGVCALVLAVSGPGLFTGPSDAVAAPASSSSVTKTVTAVRSHLDNGKNTVVLSKKVSLTVGDTTNLRDRQGIDVSWKGAEPTGGIVADANSSSATQQEYPMVLLQCRGTASAITPQTCWAPTAPQRYQFDYGNRFPSWRVDRYASATDRQQYVDEPAPRPSRCPSRPQSEHWLPFRSADGKVYYGGVNDCAGLPPDASGLDATQGLPSNATYAATGLDGTGSFQFNVRDANDNASLGCSRTVPCALVAVPVVGISCDVSATSLPPADQPSGDDATLASTVCHKSGAFQPGQISANPQNKEDLAVSGALWWSTSNWRNRITIPISFAPAANVCSLSSAQSPALIYGSELMIQATTQWAPHFCLSKTLTAFQHVQTGEPQARNLLGVKSIEAALTSSPPGDSYPVPTVHAPVAFSGFAISYAIDDDHRESYDRLKLTPRLLAKLMTESYPATIAIKSSYEALSNNPLDMSADPEFQALNPGIPAGVANGIGASALYQIASDSDVMNALTAYIAADPEARSWLNGKPDPWGMVVNPNYKNIALPVDSWPLLDPFEPKYDESNDCLQNAPVPYLPLVASPTSRLVNIALAVQFAIGNAQIVCSQPLQGSSDGEKLVASGRQTRGFRFMLGLTSLADAERYGLDTAALQTSSSVQPAEKFTTAAGRSFVTPDTGSLRAAARLVGPDAGSGGWPIPYAKFRSATGTGAYPGAMVVYADVPTTGLPKADATAYAELLAFAAGPGQVSGDGIGQLPPGYLSLTAANGLGQLARYTSAAATDVTAQTGKVPPLVPGAVAPPAIEPAGGTHPRSGGTHPGAGQVTPAAPQPTAGTPGGRAPAAGSARPTASTPKVAPASTPSTVDAAPVGKTIGTDNGTLSVLLILLIALALLGPLLARGLLFANRRVGR